MLTNPESIAVVISVSVEAARIRMCTTPGIVSLCSLQWRIVDDSLQPAAITQ